MCVKRRWSIYCSRAGKGIITMLEMRSQNSLGSNFRHFYSGVFCFRYSFLRLGSTIMRKLHRLLAITYHPYLPCYHLAIVSAHHHTSTHPTSLIYFQTHTHLHPSRSVLLSLSRHIFSPRSVIDFSTLSSLSSKQSSHSHYPTRLPRNLVQSFSKPLPQEVSRGVEWNLSFEQ